MKTAERALYKAKYISEVSKEIDEERLGWCTGYYFLDESTGRHRILPKKFVIFEVEPETLCQFTGLLDKNGNKIFEGDFIIDDDLEVGVCVFENGRFVRKFSDDAREDIKYSKEYELTGKNVFDLNYS